MTTKVGELYLIADATLEKERIMHKIFDAVKNGVGIVQLYNTEKLSAEQIATLNALCTICHQNHVSVLVNNNWQLLTKTLLDGVHFDSIPTNFQEIKQIIGRHFLSGITCSNDLSVVEWAAEHQFDYISFCSMFPSLTANQCEIVSFDTVKQARMITDMPLFVAGGINLNNLNELSELPINGIAVVSGIMSSDDVPTITKKYFSEINKITKHDIRDY